ncbi:MMPL family transporter, partial [Candidatus Calescamantes bacterium]|nr:MMPL family transporter [Candidatus Calescamantes bacterium]
VMISSIMIGVGVDYTIHFLWRYRKERRGAMAPEDAVRKTLTTTGRGIIFNAFSVIVGFVVLFISGFLPVKFFGFLVTVSIFSCLLGALILIPSLCLLLRPRFLEPLTGENHET